jgi:predicted small integral membrane protein
MCFGKTNILQTICVAIHYMEMYGMWSSSTWKGMECGEHLQIVIEIMAKR